MIILDKMAIAFIVFVFLAILFIQHAYAGDCHPSWGTTRKVSERMCAANKARDMKILESRKRYYQNCQKYDTTRSYDLRYVASFLFDDLKCWLYA
jgi:hypothetical protein